MNSSGATGTTTNVDDPNGASSTWLAMRRLVRSRTAEPPANAADTFDEFPDMSALVPADMFDSNLTTSSSSSTIRTKNTFLEVQDDVERVELERLRSHRSNSLPPGCGRVSDKPSTLSIIDQMLLFQASMSNGGRTASCQKSPEIASPTVGQDSPTSPPARYFVGGLSPATRDHDLYEHFSQFGELTESAVILDRRSKQSRGFGFISFQQGEIPQAVLEREHIIDGKRVGLRLYGMNSASKGRA